MKLNKKNILYSLVVIIIVLFLAMYQLPYYIYKPGGADALTPIVEVDGGNESSGEMHLVTVSGGQATPFQLLLAKMLPHHQILPIEDVRPEGITDEEYMHAQLQMMESSQEASTVVAYEEADEDITINFDGVYVVSVIDDMPAEDVIQMGDRIVGIDNNEVKEADDLINYINSKSAGDKVDIKFIRDEETSNETITLKGFEAEEDKVGIGIQLVTNREVTVDPEVSFSSGSIGGPSAGLMFALEIYNQLTEKDLTSGHEIAGTGEVDYEGNVLRIGGIDKKVIAADKEGCEIFFAPNEGGVSESNYTEAKETAEEIDSNMKIIPVDTFDDARTYLEELE